MINAMLEYQKADAKLIELEKSFAESEFPNIFLKYTFYFRIV